MSLEAELTAAAEDEAERACTLGWRELSPHTPWGDTFEGFTPAGLEVCIERTYLWDQEEGGDIRVEVTVYQSDDYEHGVRVTRDIRREAS